MMGDSLIASGRVPKTKRTDFTNPQCSAELGERWKRVQKRARLFSAGYLPAALTATGAKARLMARSSSSLS